MDEATILKRKEYLAKNGWVANTIGVGKAGETEFIVSRKWLVADAKMAIGLMPASNPETTLQFPSGNAGDCAAFSFVTGDPKVSNKFNSANWVALHLKSN